MFSIVHNTIYIVEIELKDVIVYKIKELPYEAINHSIISYLYIYMAIQFFPVNHLSSLAIECFSAASQQCLTLGRITIIFHNFNSSTKIQEVINILYGILFLSLYWPTTLSNLLVQLYNKQREHTVFFHGCSASTVNRTTTTTSPSSNS